MNGLREIIQIVQNIINEDYGKGKINYKDARTALIVLPSMVIYLMIMSFQCPVNSFGFWAFLYGYIVILCEILMFIATLICDSTKNSNKNEKIKKRFLIWSTFLFFISLALLIIILYLFNFIIQLFKIEILVKNIGKATLNLLIYFIALISCIILFEEINDMNIIYYILLILIIYFASLFVRFIIDKKTKYRSYQEKYEYLYFTRKLTNYFIVSFTIVSAVAGLLTSTPNENSIIITLIIFAGCDQMIMLRHQNVGDKNKTIKQLYDELIVVKDIAYPQIKNFTCIKIKIKVSITPWIIRNHVNYLKYENNSYQMLKFKKRKSSKDFLISTLEGCEKMLSKEYLVYLDIEKIELENELLSKVEDLAKYLTDVI